MYLYRAVVVCISLAETLTAATLCVNSHHPGCYSTIQAAVNHASAGDVINVAPGTYKEYVTIGIPVSILGVSANSTIVDATGLAHGFFVDGFDHAGLTNVTIENFTVENADFEGILVVSASGVQIRNNNVINNDATPGLEFTAPTGCPNQPGNGVYENDETGDCGGAVHLIGTSHSVVSDNLITGNADGAFRNFRGAAVEMSVMLTLQPCGSRSIVGKWFGDLSTVDPL